MHNECAKSDRAPVIALGLSSPSLIGMVHLGPLPGTPAACETVASIAAAAVRDARILRDVGFDAVLVENMNDVPYLRRRVGPEIVAAATVCVAAVAQAVDCPVGVQILAGCNRESLAVALAAGGSFVRVEGFVFAHVADEGTFDADAGDLLRYRRAIGADHISVFADIRKKHSSHALTADLDIAEHARAAAFFRADGVVVTGTATGRPVDLQELTAARAATTLPVIVGSGATPELLPALWPHASAVIVGSYVKTDGDWRNHVDPNRARLMAHAAQAIRDGRNQEDPTP